MNTPIDNPIIIWRLLDGKPGHQNQTLGLINALKRRQSCQSYDIYVGKNDALIPILSASWPLGSGLPLPDIIMGAGHRTHLHLLAAKRVYGGKTIVLMKPSLPASLFDLCFIPEHDNYQGYGNVVATKGVLNPLHYQGEHRANQSVIMIGGPSRHHQWDGEQLLSQITTLLQQNTNINYILTTSRRTPTEFTDALKQLSFDNLTNCLFADTSSDWVAEQLARSSTAWITEDSVSMIYEALTARVGVGILSMPIKQENRVSRGVKKLLDNNFIVRFDKQRDNQNVLKPIAGFIEADRCADWMLTQWMEELPEAIEPVMA